MTHFKGHEQNDPKPAIDIWHQDKVNPCFNITEMRLEPPLAYKIILFWIQILTEFFLMLQESFVK